MPARLVVLAEEVLFRGGAEASERGTFEALARLTHAGHPVAVILAGRPADSAAPRELQQFAHETGGQVVAFFHRAGGDDLSRLLAEVIQRWRVDPGQVHGVFLAPEDLAGAAGFGATAVALADPHAPRDALPSDCVVHDDLAAFVDALLDTADVAT